MATASSSKRDATRIIDSIVGVIVRSCGIATITAVGAVCVFLLWVTKDLFYSAEVTPGQKFPPPGGQQSAEVRAMQTGCDEHRVIFWTLLDTGRIEVRRLDTGELLTELSARAEDQPAVPGLVTASSISGKILTLGYRDGRVRIMSVDFETSFLDDDEVPEQLRNLKTKGRWEESMVERTPQDQLRRQNIKVETVFASPASAPLSSRALVAVQYSRQIPRIAALDEEGAVFLLDGRSELNMLTAETELNFDGEPIQLQTPGVAEASTGPSNLRRTPRFIALLDRGTQLLTVTAEALIERYNLRIESSPVLVETVHSLRHRKVKPTAVSRLLGESTMIVGDSEGRVFGMFNAEAPGTNKDNRRLVLAHELAMPEPAPAVAIASSQRQRMFLVSNAKGGIDAWHMTSHKLLAHLPRSAGQPVQALCIAPKDNALLAVGPDAVQSWDLDPRHPDVTFHSLFGRVWYEGYAKPGTTWQSSSAEDSSEPKMSLMPLIFGTLKATFYSMLFAIPLALLAALYTSEFMNKKIRPRIKSSIELMASLPSVVLGFVAALVIAPALEGFVAAALLAMFTIPLMLLLGAYIYQILPLHVVRSTAMLRLPLALVAIGLGILVANGFADTTNAVLFEGDIRSWLNSQSGDGWVGWFLILLPTAAVAVGLAHYFWLGKLFPARASHVADAGQALLKFVAGATVTLLLAMLLSSLCYSWLPAVVGNAPADLREGFEVFGFDLSPFGSIDANNVPGFDQRNALVVGFIMGFAVIPIIYTIAEDALSRVPDHLRAASLAAGATTWQTAMRVVLPSAISGLFSAVIIGLGRAVGETMIVLMAAGNTPLQSMNMFNGFRTLSANIATELPEAVRDSSHYRTLFLAALVLFAMTFVINTLAEAVRIHFRRKAAQL